MNLFRRFRFKGIFLWVCAVLLLVPGAYSAAEEEDELLIEEIVEYVDLDAVTDGERPSGVLSDEPLVLQVGVHTVVEHLADVEQPVERSELDECSELRHLDNGTLNELVLLELEYDLVEGDVLVDGSVAVDDASVSDTLHVLHEYSD